MSDFITGQGRPIRLGRELARGGEGAIFEVADNANVLAKLYLRDELRRDRAQKLPALISLRSETLSRLTAWPIDTVARPSGETVGLLMPRILGHKDIHQLYGPKSRRHEFMRADWRFLIRAAVNTARAFAVVHDAGCVIGDVNHGGILVAQDATVRLIDCDSFQVIVGSKRYLCEVGVDIFTPPELQARSFAGVVRTPNHDAFGLAVLIFLTLFMGRHPFAGRFLGPGDMPIGKAIQQSRFAYGQKRALVQMEKPPGAPSLEIVGEAAPLFEQAFSSVASLGGRPTAADWVRGLETLEKQLRQCSSTASHWYHRGLRSCPWCTMETELGVSLFPVVLPTGPGNLFNMATFWAQVEAVAHPGQAPALATASASASTEARNAGRVAKMRIPAALAVGAAILLIGFNIAALAASPLLVIGGALVAFFVMKAMIPEPTSVELFRQRQADAAARYGAAINEWNLRASAQAFEERKSQLDRLKKQWSDIPSVRLRKLGELKANQRALQLEQFLDAFEIERATISGIGSGRKQTLESYGIETAADVVSYRISAIPGFGPSLCSKLIAWRQSLEKRFVFDANKAIDPSAVAKVEQEILVERQKIEKELASVLAELKAVRNHTLAARQHLRPQVEGAQRALAQAQADFAAATS